MIHPHAFRLDLQLGWCDMRVHIMAGLTCDDLLLSPRWSGLRFPASYSELWRLWLLSFCAIPFDYLYLFNCTHTQTLCYFT